MENLNIVAEHGTDGWWKVEFDHPLYGPTIYLLDDASYPSRELMIEGIKFMVEEDINDATFN